MATSSSTISEISRDFVQTLARAVFEKNKKEDSISKIFGRDDIQSLDLNDTNSFSDEDVKTALQNIVSLVSLKDLLTLPQKEDNTEALSKAALSQETIASKELLQSIKENEQDFYVWMIQNVHYLSAVSRISLGSEKRQELNRLDDKLLEICKKQNTYLSFKHYVTSVRDKLSVGNPLSELYKLVSEYEKLEWSISKINEEKLFRETFKKLKELFSEEEAEEKNEEILKRAFSILKNTLETERKYFSKEAQRSLLILTLEELTLLLNSVAQEEDNSDDSETKTRFDSRPESSMRDTKVRRNSTINSSLTNVNTAKPAQASAISSTDEDFSAYRPKTAVLESGYEWNKGFPWPHDPSEQVASTKSVELPASQQSPGSLSDSYESESSADRSSGEDSNLAADSIAPDVFTQEQSAAASELGSSVVDFVKQRTSLVVEAVSKKVAGATQPTPTIGGPSGFRHAGHVEKATTETGSSLEECIASAIQPKGTRPTSAPEDEDSPDKAIGSLRASANSVTRSDFPDNSSDSKQTAMTEPDHSKPRQSRTSGVFGRRPSIFGGLFTSLEGGTAPTTNSEPSLLKRASMLFSRDHERSSASTSACAVDPETKMAASGPDLVEDTPKMMLYCQGKNRTWENCKEDPPGENDFVIDNKGKVYYLIKGKEYSISKESVLSLSTSEARPDAFNADFSNICAAIFNGVKTYPVKAGHSLLFLITIRDAHQDFLKEQSNASSSNNIFRLDPGYLQRGQLDDQVKNVVLIKAEKKERINGIRMKINHHEKNQAVAFAIRGCDGSHIEIYYKEGHEMHLLKLNPSEFTGEKFIEVNNSSFTASLKKFMNRFSVHKFLQYIIVNKEDPVFTQLYTALFYIKEQHQVSMNSTMSLEEESSAGESSDSVAVESTVPSEKGANAGESSGSAGVEPTAPSENKLSAGKRPQSEFFAGKETGRQTGTNLSRRNSL